MDIDTIFHVPLRWEFPLCANSYMIILDQQINFYTMKTPTIQTLQVEGAEVKTRKTSQYALTNISGFQSFEYCSSLQLQDSSKECRICLEQIEDITHVFISPCRCIGTLRYVHQSCFMTWLERQYESKTPKEQKRMQQRGVDCEICKIKIYLTFARTRMCLSRDEIKDRIKRNSLLFGLLLLFLLLMIASLFFLVYLIKQSANTMATDIILTSVILSGAMFLILGVVLTSCYLVGKFCLEERNKLQSFRLNKTPQPKKRQIIPQE